MLHINATILLAGSHLQKVYKSTMAHGIETRVPTMHVPRASFSISLPSKLRMRRGQKKAVAAPQRTSKVVESKAARHWRSA